MANIFKSLIVGAKRRPIVGISGGLVFLGALWTITEIAAFVSSAARAFLESNRDLYLALAIVGSAVAFLIRVYEPSKVAFCVPTTDTKVTLKFGDLFAEDADIVAAVTEYVDSEIGQRVAPGSIHGQLIRNWFNSEADFRSAVDAQLAEHSATTTNRATGPNLAYPLGTTIRINAGPRRAYVFVFAHADPHTDKAFVDLSEAMAALRTLLLFVHNTASGRPVAMPLIGNGQSGLNLPPQHLLRLLVLLIVAAARERGLPKDVRVCLHQDCFEQLDLREIARDWRHD